MFVITHRGDLAAAVEGVFQVPKSEPEFDAILWNVPLQLLAHHVAVLKRVNISQPRNLAKSVTVESPSRYTAAALSRNRTP